MSRLIDKLNRVSKAVSQPVGFRAAQPVSPKPRILLIASLVQANVNSLVDYVAGADAGLLHISNLSSGAETFQKISQAMPDIPWGGWLGDSSQGGIEELGKVGCDFVVFPAARTPLAILQNDEVGKILEVESSLDDGLLRAVNELPVDAVLIGGKQEEEYFLTWHHLMLFQHFANLLTKPVLVYIPPKVTANEFQALWQAKVDGVLVGVEAGQPNRLKGLRQIVDKIAFPLPRKWGRVEALLPYVSQETGIVTEEEEE